MTATMLSATPGNNRFYDLKNQLQLVYEGHSEDFNHLLGEGKDIDDIFKNAQKAYNRWNKLPNEERTTERLQDELSFDFFDQLASRIKADTGMNVALITGNTEGKCTIARFPMSFNKISIGFDELPRQPYHSLYF